MGSTIEELKDHSMKFENYLKKRKMTQHEDKTCREVEMITIFGYENGNGRICPGSDLPVPAPVPKLVPGEFEISKKS